MKADKLTNGIQESILAIQAFDDDASSSAVLSLVEPKSLDPYFRDIAEGIRDYRREHKKAPKSFLHDIVESIAVRKPDEAEQFWELYRSVLRLNKEGVQKPAVLDRAKYFVRAQRMRLDMAKVLDLLEVGTKQSIIEADNILRTRPTDIDVFNLGTKFNDPKQALKFITNPESEVFPIGIKELDQWEAGPMRGGLWNFIAPTNRGKSIGLKCRVWLPSVGYRTMKECVADSKGLIVYGVHRHKWKPTPTRVLKAMPSGMKPTCKIHLRSGRVVDGLSDTHPVLTWNGYVPAKNLKVGDFTLGSSELPLEGLANAREVQECYVVGAFIGDGALTAKQLCFCGSDDKRGVIDFISKILKLNPTLRQQGRALDARYSIKAFEFLNKWGVERKLSKFRNVPSKIYEKGKEAVAACMAGLFDTDGSCCLNDSGADVEFSTASHALSEDYLTMLNVLGIYATRREKTITLNGKNFKAWIVTFRDAASVETFEKVVGKHGKNSKKWTKLGSRNSIELNKSKGQFYQRLPYMAWDRVRNALKGSTRWSEKSMAGAFKLAGQSNVQQAAERVRNCIKRKTRIDPQLATALAAYIEDKWLHQVASGGFVFDEITKIEWREPEECWDFCTEDDTQSFLAEHVFTHNTWMALHVAKTMMRFGKKVIYITLEMSEEKISARLCQSLFSLTKRKQEVKLSRLQKDKAGRFVGVQEETMFRPFLSNEDIYTLLEKKLNPLRHRPQIWIKKFPRGKLTVPMLEAYLDQLEHIERFRPDCLIIDYPKLMEKGDPRFMRQNLGKISEDIAGIADERMLAAVILSQSNRAGYKAGLVELDNQSEESITNETADTSITYNQTKAEKARNLARLYVAKSRGDLAQFQVLVSQAYAMGQFALDSLMLSNATQYEKLLNGDDADEDDVE